MRIFWHKSHYTHDSDFFRKINSRDRTSISYGNQVRNLQCAIVKFARFKTADEAIEIALS